MGLQDDADLVVKKIMSVKGGTIRSSYQLPISRTDSTISLISAAFLEGKSDMDEVVGVCASIAYIGQVSSTSSNTIDLLYFATNRDTLVQDYVLSY